MATVTDMATATDNPARESELRDPASTELHDQIDAQLRDAIGDDVALARQGVPEHRPERVLVLDEQDASGSRHAAPDGRAIAIAPSQSARPPCGPPPGCP